MRKAALLFALLSMSSVSTVFAANYDYISYGDAYYINRFGSNNDYVVVQEKLGNNMVKVRNVETGATITIDASKLLTKSELDTKETVNTIGGAALIFCVLGGCK